MISLNLSPVAYQANPYISDLKSMKQQRVFLTERDATTNIKINLLLPISTPG